LIARLESLKERITDKHKLDNISGIFKDSMTTLHEAFHLTDEMFNLSQTEAKALENYLYANDLIIQCKK